MLAEGSHQVQHIHKDGKAVELSKLILAVGSHLFGRFLTSGREICQYHL
jgi:hypothetical protein